MTSTLKNDGIHREYYPTFVGNEQHDNQYYYDVPQSFYDKFNHITNTNPGLTAKEYVDLIDFYDFTEDTLVGFFKLVNTHRNTFYKVCGPFKYFNKRWWPPWGPKVVDTRSLSYLHNKIKELTDENTRLKKTISEWVKWSNQNDSNEN